MADDEVEEPRLIRDLKEDLVEFLQDFDYRALSEVELVEALSQSYAINRFGGDAWGDGNYAGYWSAREQYGDFHPMDKYVIHDDDELVNPFRKDCCPTLKVHEGHKMGCPVGGVKRLEIPVNVSEDNTWQVSPVYKEYLEDGSLETPESQD